MDGFVPRRASRRQLMKKNWLDTTNRRKRDMTAHYTLYSARHRRTADRRTGGLRYLLDHPRRETIVVCHPARRFAKSQTPQDRGLR